MATALASAPEQGQLVSVRFRNWIVNEVVLSTLPTSGLHGISDPQTLVSLASVEDDGLGEEIQVVWELESGARLIEKVALPDQTGFDPPDRLNAYLDAVRWGASSSADVRNIQSPFRSGIDIEDYQLDPVVRAIQMPRVNLLVAVALLIEAAKDHAAQLARANKKMVWLVLSRRHSIRFDATGKEDLPAEATPDMPCEPYLVIGGKRVHFGLTGGSNLRQIEEPSG